MAEGWSLLPVRRVGVLAVLHGVVSEAGATEV
jgi:hypothetical protein